MEREDIVSEDKVSEDKVKVGKFWWSHIIKGKVPAGIKLNKTYIGSRVTPHEVYIYDDDSAEEVNKKIDAKIRRTGKSRYDGNIQRFYRVYEVIDDEGNPTWHPKDCMRTMHVRNLVTVALSTGKMTTKRYSTFYKDWTKD